MIRARLFHAGMPPQDVEIGDCGTLAADDSNLVWVDLAAPAEEEIAHVCAVFGMTRKAAEMGRQRSQRPLLRAFPDHYLVTALTIDVDETPTVPRIAVDAVDLLVARNVVVSVHKGPLPFAEQLDERTATNPELGRFDSSYLLYVVLDSLVSHYALEFDEVEDEVERLEEQLLSAPGRGALDQVMAMRRHIHNVRRIVAPHREVFIGLAAPDSPIPQQQVEAHFRDLLAHLNQLIEALDHERDILTGAHDLYISNISYQTNQQLRVLTFLSAVLLPMTVITGLFGTNFKLNEYEAWEPFYVMIIGMALITAGMLAFFRWRRWL